MLKRSFYLNRVFLLFLCIIVLSTSLIGCSTDRRINNNASVTFCDDLNRTVVLDKKPERVAALMGSLADIWCLSGGKICASVDDAWTDFDLPVENAINLGKLNEPDFEKLISSEPDLIIASSTLPSNIKNRDFLENLGIPICFFNVNTFSDYLKVLGIFTDITDRKDLYETNGLNVDKNIKKILNNNNFSHLPDSERTVLFLRASSGYIRAKNSEGTILGEMLKELGFINIADNDTNLLENLSLESIIHLNPYRIFIVQTGDDEEAAKINVENMIKENPAWQSLSAVKEKRIHFMDKSLFNLKPNEKWDIAYETLCKTLSEQ